MTTVHHRNHNNPFARVVSYSAGVMPEDSAFFHPFPVAPVEVHVGSADAARLKMYKYPVALNFWFWNIFDFDVVWSTVNSSFQKLPNS
jgi:hypothetical protein